MLLAALIAFQGLCTHTIGAGTEGPADLQAGAPLNGSRPLLVAQGDRLRSPQPDPGKRIALTFDDGPDPQWTPKILEVLRRERVPGTFFVMSSGVSAWAMALGTFQVSPTATALPGSTPVTNRVSKCSLVSSNSERNRAPVGQ